MDLNADQPGIGTPLTPEQKRIRLFDAKNRYLRCAFN